jgi:hypothetical protein
MFRLLLQAYILIPFLLHILCVAFIQSCLHQRGIQFLAVLFAAFVYFAVPIIKEIVDDYMETFNRITQLRVGVIQTVQAIWARICQNLRPIEQKNAYQQRLLTNTAETTLIREEIHDYKADESEWAFYDEEDYDEDDLEYMEDLSLYVNGWLQDVEMETTKRHAKLRQLVEFRMDNFYIEDDLFEDLCDFYEKGSRSESENFGYLKYLFCPCGRCFFPICGAFACGFMYWENKAYSSLLKKKYPSKSR